MAGGDVVWGVMDDAIGTAKVSSPLDGEIAGDVVEPAVGPAQSQVRNLKVRRRVHVVEGEIVGPGGRGAGQRDKHGEQGKEETGAHRSGRSTAR